MSSAGSWGEGQLLGRALPCKLMHPLGPWPAAMARNLHHTMCTSFITSPFLPFHPPHRAGGHNVIIGKWAGPHVAGQDRAAPLPPAPAAAGAANNTAF
jgi:hypothetical protein